MSEKQELLKIMESMIDKTSNKEVKKGMAKIYEMTLCFDFAEWQEAMEQEKNDFVIDCLK